MAIFQFNYSVFSQQICFAVSALPYSLPQAQETPEASQKVFFPGFRIILFLQVFPSGIDRLRRNTVSVKLKEMLSLPLFILCI